MNVKSPRLSMTAMRAQSEAHPDTAPPATAPAPSPAPVPPPVLDGPERVGRAGDRTSFGSTIRRDLHKMLRVEAPELSDVLGRRVLIEEILEGLLLEYRDDPALRERVRGRLPKD